MKYKKRALQAENSMIKSYKQKGNKDESIQKIKSK